MFFSIKFLPPNSLEVTTELNRFDCPFVENNELEDVADCDEDTGAMRPKSNKLGSKNEMKIKISNNVLSI